MTPTAEPSWLVTLQAVGAQPSEEWRPLQPASAPGLQQTQALGPRPPPREPPQGPDPDPALVTHGDKARWLLHVAARGRQDARRVAEDLAMSLLMSPVDGKFHPAARLVLNDPELAVARGLELAARLLGSRPRKSTRERRT